MDTAKIEAGVRLILEGVGEDPEREGLRETPARVARMYEEVQERLTGQIADTLVEALHPAGVIVVLEAEHMCMSMRGVKKPGAKTTTRAVRGCFETDADARSEALSLIFRH